MSLQNEKQMLRNVCYLLYAEAGKSQSPHGTKKHCGIRSAFLDRIQLKLAEACASSVESASGVSASISSQGLAAEIVRSRCGYCWIT